MTTTTTTTTMPTSLEFNTSFSSSDSFNLSTYGPTTANKTGEFRVETYSDLYEVFQHHIPVAIMVDKCITPVLCIIGFVGNTISVRIWIMRRMRKCNRSVTRLSSQRWEPPSRAIQILKVTFSFFLELSSWKTQFPCESG
jgi:hypothetical protein